MGSKSSKVTGIYNNNEEWINSKKRAEALYLYRVRNYNPLVNGTRKYYMTKVETEYKLACIPPHLRSDINKVHHFDLIGK